MSCSCLASISPERAGRTKNPIAKIGRFVASGGVSVTLAQLPCRINTLQIDKESEEQKVVTRRAELTIPFGTKNREIRAEMTVRRSLWARETVFSLES
jgi:hypothetical protein